MKRPQEIRAAPKEWIPILQLVHSFLRTELGIGDLLLYGSQVLSLYMRTPLRSKDLDLLSNQVSFRQMELLADEISKLQNVELRTVTAQTRRFDSRKMTTYAIELRVSSKPFFVELVDSILDGRSPSILMPYVLRVKRWGLEIWAPSREATLALRLAFRRPEGITRLNAMRLNRFIRDNRRSLQVDVAKSILEEWGVIDWVEGNLVELYARNKVRITNDRKIIPEIELKLAGKRR